MPKSRGNPNFGPDNEHRFYYGREEPLTAQVKAVVYPSVKEKLKELADEKGCTVPDLIREALDLYLASRGILSSEQEIEMPKAS